MISWIKALWDGCFTPEGIGVKYNNRKIGNQAPYFSII
jgi:hypothetical protein